MCQHTCRLVHVKGKWNALRTCLLYLHQVATKAWVQRQHKDKVRQVRTKWQMCLSKPSHAQVEVDVEKVPPPKEPSQQQGAVGATLRRCTWTH